MKKRDTVILLVDDEPDILEIIGYNLTGEGYQVVTAKNGVEAITMAIKHKPKLIVLDVMMPEMDGMEACEKLRAIPELAETVITFLTARDEDYSQVAGFEAGADDYITKPIKPKVLLSKVKSLLRRFKENDDDVPNVKLGNITINREEYKISVGKEEMILPRKEFELLSLLASKPGKVFTREDILDKVWGNEVIVGGRTIDVHIRKLREKIGDKKFKTIKGVGYKFVV
ncbi:MAG: response regulator transcription factor [Patiriisocius sp.]|uniref:response regulator transcription factor n=1 Tax=Patiriisocius sp. TaxID=2822396 RepID=UPI003EF36292